MPVFLLCELSGRVNSESRTPPLLSSPFDFWHLSLRNPSGRVVIVPLFDWTMQVCRRTFLLRYLAQGARRRAAQATVCTPLFRLLQRSEADEFLTWALSSPYLDPGAFSLFFCMLSIAFTRQEVVFHRLTPSLFSVSFLEGCSGVFPSQFVPLSPSTFC